MTVGELCIENTQFSELCAFRKSDWIVGTTWNDLDDQYMEVME